MVKDDGVSDHRKKTVSKEQMEKMETDKKDKVSAISIANKIRQSTSRPPARFSTKFSIFKSSKKETQEIIEYSEFTPENSPESKKVAPPVSQPAVEALKLPKHA
jgi:hypothetical protein